MNTHSLRGFQRVGYYLYLKSKKGEGRGGVYFPSLDSPPIMTRVMFLYQCQTLLLSRLMGLDSDI